MALSLPEHRLSFRTYYLILQYCNNTMLILLGVITAYDCYPVFCNPFQQNNNLLVASLQCTDSCTVHPIRCPRISTSTHSTIHLPLLSSMAFSRSARALGISFISLYTCRPGTEGGIRYRSTSICVCTMLAIVTTYSKYKVFTISMCHWKM